jgi:serine protease Do
VVQTTASISSGSSGSPLMNEKGEVFAIATFKRKGGENINFGVMLNENFQEELDSKEFSKKNRKFNSTKSEFILLNIPPDKGSDLMLNGIEFGPTATTLYLTFTNMHLTSNGIWTIWAEVGKKDKGFFIEDKETKERYYITSSTLATDKEKAEPVGLGEVLQFKVHFPVIKNKLVNIDIKWGEGDRDSHFTNINLDDYRNSLSIDEFGYKREYALKYTTEGGNFVATMEILTELLDENPSDVISLNMMAILSYIIENKTDAMFYLEEAIEQNPNDELAYLNRSSMYEFSEQYTDAIKDITSAINLAPEQPDYYYSRALDYYLIKEYKKALDDLNKCLDLSNKEDGFEDSPYFYELRAYIYYYLNNIKSARTDVQKAYKLSKDKDLDERLQNFYSIL